MRRLSVVAAVLVSVLGAACGGPEQPVTFGGKAVPVKVSFGKPGEDDPGVPKGAVLAPVMGAVGVVPVAPVRDRDGGPLPWPEQPPGQPSVDCTRPDIVKPPVDEASRHLVAAVPVGELLYRIDGVVGGEKVAGFFMREVKDLAEAPDGAVSFTVASNVLGVTSSQRFQSRPQNGRVPGAVGLQAVEAEGAGVDGRPSFSSPKALTLLPLDVTPATTFEDATFDPLTGTTYRVSGQVIGKSKVWACGDNIDAWQVKLAQRVVTPLQDITSDVTAWIATQYGGLVVQEAAAWSGMVGPARNQPVQGQYTVTISQVPGP